MPLDFYSKTAEFSLAKESYLEFIIAGYICLRNSLWVYYDDCLSFTYACLPLILALVFLLS